MILRYAICVLGLSVAASILLSSHARADVIDGDWCYKDGRHMSINGPQIVTPTGKLLMGEYTRHTFSYTVPEGDPDAGTILSMILENEETVHVMRHGKMKAEKAPEVEVWQRCKPVA